MKSLLDIGEEEGAIEEDEKLMISTLDEHGKSVKAVMKPAHFVRDTARVDNLLKEFREGKFHIAIVVNAAGRTAGLVSLEDPLEEIVGSIYDEYDVRKNPLRRPNEPERQEQRTV